MRPEPSVLWASTSMRTRGGVASSVRMLSQSPLWPAWGVRHVTTHRDGSKLTKLAAFGGGLLRYVAQVVGRRPQLVHIHTSADASFVRKSVLVGIARALRIPIVLHVHSGQFGAFYEQASVPAKGIIRAVLGWTDRVVALDAVMADCLRAISPRIRLVTIPNTIQFQDMVSPPAPGDPVRVVYLGRIAQEKGTFDLLDAWCEVMRQDGVEATLTIAGDGDVEAAIQAVRRLGIAGSVEVRTWLSAEAVQELLGGSHVLVLPSHSEGQPMAVLEAMAHGLCVVASRVGGIPTMIEDDVSGLLVPPADVPELAATLLRAITDDANRAQVGKAAHAHVRREFDIDMIWLRFDALYQDILGSSTRSIRIDEGVTT